MIEINGIAHTVLTVSDVARSRSFYEPLLTFLGLKKVADGPTGFYFIGGRTALAIMESPDGGNATGFHQSRIGLHHLCFRARARDDVTAVHDFLVERRAKIVQPAQDGPWAPGYYSVLFEDPDGIRLEINFVPGKGVLAEGAAFNPDGYDMGPV